MKGGRVPACCRRFTAWGVLVVSVAGLAGAPRASASQILAVESEGLRADAGHGLIIWSSYDAAIHAYRLKAYRDGQATTLPVAPSPSIFDASVGTDVSGHPAIVYARCARPGHSAVSSDAGYRYAPPRECDIHELDPNSGVDRPVIGASDPAISETNPTIWHGRVAFARQKPTRCNAFGPLPGLPQLALVEPHGRPRLLRNGPVSGHACARLDGERLTASGLLVLWTWQCDPPVQGCVYLNDLLLVGLHHRRVLLRSSSGEGGPSELVGPPVVRGDHVYLAGATLGFGSRLLRVPLHPRNGPPIAAAAPGVDVPDPLVPISSALRYGDRYLLARGLLGSQTNAVFCQETHPDLLGNTPCQLELTDPVTFPQ